MVIRFKTCYPFDKFKNPISFKYLINMLLRKLILISYIKSGIIIISLSRKELKFNNNILNSKQSNLFE